MSPIREQKPVTKKKIKKPSLRTVTKKLHEAELKLKQKDLSVANLEQRVREVQDKASAAQYQREELARYKEAANKEAAARVSAEHVAESLRNQAALVNASNELSALRDGMVKLEAENNGLKAALRSLVA